MHVKWTRQDPPRTNDAAGAPKISILGEPPNCENAARAKTLTSASIQKQHNPEEILHFVLPENDALGSVSTQPTCELRQESREAPS